jgi:hypothetical protein
MTGDEHDFDREDLRAFQDEMRRASQLADGFGRAMTRAFEGAAVRGRDFGDVLRSLALQLSSMAIGSALRPVSQGFAELLGGAPGGSGPADAWADIRNDLTRLDSSQAFAPGGIAEPSYFPTAFGDNHFSAMSAFDRSPAAARPFAVNVNVSTPDAASFRRSEAYLSGAIARAVARGERNL